MLSITSPAIDARNFSCYVIGRTIGAQGKLSVISTPGYSLGLLRAYASTAIPPVIWTSSRNSGIPHRMNLSAYSVVSAAGGATVWANGSTPAAVAAVTAGSGAGFEICATDNALFAAMDVHEIFIYNAAQTACDAQATKDYIFAKYGIRSTPCTKAIVFEGDSLTDGNRSGGALSYPFQLAMDPSLADWRMTNHGTSGANIAALTARQTSVNATLLAGATRNVLVLLIGRNDVPASVGSAVYANLVPLAQGYVAAGHEVYVCTNLGTANSAYQARLTDLSNLIRSSIVTDAGVAGVIDLYAHPLLGPGSTGNLTYWSGDGTHPNATGYGVMTAEIKSGIPALTL